MNDFAVIVDDTLKAYQAAYAKLIEQGFEWNGTQWVGHPLECLHAPYCHCLDPDR